jgi:predicted ATPase/DNA-binding SARP family transcriptional activator/DNA-binding CsgD family transcriptional regulator
MASSGVLVGLLGPVEVASPGGRLTGIAQPLVRVLLAMLAVAPGRVVPDEALVDALWGEEWSRSRERNLHSHVSALRRLLPAADRSDSESRVVRSGGGYRLVVGDAELDVSLFRVLAGQGREAARAGDPAAGAELCARALGLWRGPALADVTGLCARLAGDAAALGDLRAAVMQERLECDLVLGRHAEVAADGAALLAEFPLDERLAGQVMVALYRCERRGEALAVFDRTRRTLAEELGLDPGPALREIHAQVLADDLALAMPVAVPAGRTHDRRAGADAPASAAAVPVEAGAAPRQLPAETRSTGAGGMHGFGLPRTSFVGRAGHVAEVASLLAEFHLVTVTGPGGVGKTRLACEVAREVAGRFTDGAWLAELAAISDPERLSSALAEALGLQLAPGVRLGDVLGRRQLLVVLDNCEHVLEEAASLCESLLDSADDVRVLATSREPLGVAGECRYRLGPLRLPDPDGKAPAAEAADEIAEAMTLFAERARLAHPGFIMDAVAAPAVAQIVTRLDGIPLAIELAAARVESLGLDQLAARPGNRLRLLAGSGRAALGRHGSLAAVADWSYRLLDDAGQRVFRALSVFPGPFTLEAAEAVAGPAAGIAVLRLVDCSLVAPPRPGQDGRTRYVLLETLRAFGSERLGDGGERSSVDAALARFAVGVAEEAAGGLLTTADEEPAGRWLDAEESTLYYALAWALEYDTSLALRLAISMVMWWVNRSRFAEGYRLLKEAAQHAEPGTDQWCTAQFFLGYLSGQLSVADCLAHMSAVVNDLTGRGVRVPLLARAGAARALCLAYLNRDSEADVERDSEAVAEARGALDLAVELEDPFGEAFALVVLGNMSLFLSSVGEALAWFRRAQQVDLTAAPGWVARQCLIYLAVALGEVGEMVEAREHCERALSLARNADALSDEGGCLALLAEFDMSNDELDGATAHLQAAVGLYSRTGTVILLLSILGCCAELCDRTEHWREAVILRAAADAINERTVGFGSLHGRGEMAAARRAREAAAARRAREALRPAETRAATQSGSAMTPDAAAAYALEVAHAIELHHWRRRPREAALDGRSADTRTSWHHDEPASEPSLTVRERELIVLVAQGHTDAQIADRLHISIHTVRSHLDGIRNKTGCQRRAELTRLALQAALI